MGIKFGIRMMFGDDNVDTVYCDYCDHYLGERHINYFQDKVSVEYKGINEDWNNCPYCGKPLELE